METETPTPGFDLAFKGLRIPYVAAWEGEAPNILWDPHVEQYAAYTGGYDHREEAESGRIGRPLLGMMSPQRQRRAMVKGLCQVCARPMRERVVIGDLNELGPDRILAIDEPPCCAACALVAIELCPFAAKRWRERGACLLTSHVLRVQMVGIEKGDDHSRFVRGGGELARGVRRRFTGKSFAMHVRLMPTGLTGLEGESGIAELRRFAEANRG